MADPSTGANADAQIVNEAGNVHPGFTGTVANATAAVLNTVGLGGVVPGQVHPDQGHAEQQAQFADQQQEPAHQQGFAANNGGNQGFDQQEAAPQHQTQQQPLHEEHRVSPQGGDTYDSTATAGQGEGHSADGRSNAQASNFNKETHQTHGGGPNDGYSHERRSSTSSETFESHETHTTHSASQSNTGGSAQQGNDTGFSSFGDGGFGGGNGNQADNPQGNAENAAGQAFKRVSRAIGKAPGNTAHAEGVSGTQGQDGAEPHGQMGSADVVKPQGAQNAQAHSSATDQHAGQGITDAVRDTM